MDILGDRYHVLRELGRGGCGVTYLAEDAHMPSRRKCVVKLLEPATKDPGAIAVIRARFEREAAVLESLSDASDQIPTLYAYLSRGPEFYLVQQYVEGPTLRQALAERGPLGERDVRAILDGMLEALRFVHGRGVIHRDVKPENIILRASDGRPVLIDFGAVKESVTTDASSGGGSTSVVIGTPGYMPLEQAAGRPVFASDLYSLGATAIVALTGRRLAELVDPATGDVIWRGLAPATSAALAALLDRATEPRASDRFRSADEMLAALRGATTPVTDVDRDVDTLPRRDPRTPAPADDTEIVPRPTGAPPALRHAATAARVASALMFAAAAAVEPVVSAIRGAALYPSAVPAASLQLALLGTCAMLLGNRRRHGAIGAVVGAAGVASCVAVYGIRPGLWMLATFALFAGGGLLAALCGVSASRVPKRLAGATVERYLMLGLFWAAADCVFLASSGRLSSYQFALFLLAVAGCALASAGGAVATAALVAVSALDLAALLLLPLNHDTRDVANYVAAMLVVALVAAPVAVWRSLRH